MVEHSAFVCQGQEFYFSCGRKKLSVTFNTKNNFKPLMQNIIF